MLLPSPLVRLLAGIDKGARLDWSGVSHARNRGFLQGGESNRAASFIGRELNGGRRARAASLGAVIRPAASTVREFCAELAGLEVER
jgi:hypothetical protein